MVVWKLARKDLRLLVRDARALVILLAMPIIFIFLLGMSVGEGFGKKEDRVRVSVLDLDEGIDPSPMIQEGMSWFALMPGIQAASPGLNVQAMGAMALAAGNHPRWFPHQKWSKVVLQDLAETADISVELVTPEQAKSLVHSGQRAAVLIFGPKFSKRVAKCSFQASGINPFFRDGVQLDKLDVSVIQDDTQPQAVGIIRQVAQGTLLRVVLPWMIGRAFGLIGDPEFIDLLGKEDVQVPVAFGKVPLKSILNLMTASQKVELGHSLQNALQKLYPNYNLTAKTWASLTRSEPTGREGQETTTYREDGAGFLKVGAYRYKLLVPSFLVMFAFFLVLTMGWLFVAERRQGTMKRLCAAPLSRTQILLGKLIPCFALSLFQGFFLLGAGKFVFGLDFGPDPLWLVPVVVSTSLAAMGLALLVAALAQTETQVAIYGTLLVMVLAGLSGALMGDRSLMSEPLQTLTRFTPHAWALDAYRELLIVPAPRLDIVAQACGVLTAFGLGFVLLAWWFLKLE
jgi:ABC-type multidrug transport system permease subunit